MERVASGRAEAFFRARAEQLAPEAIFRAKTWGRFDRQFQLSFVDSGLMPLVEQETGERLRLLIERTVSSLRLAIWPAKSALSVGDGHWLLRSAFWLLAAKILRDKKVPGFASLDLLDVKEVFAHVARHYDTSNPNTACVKIATQKQQAALEAAAKGIAAFSHLGNVTTESLAHVYESTLITKETRASLGTHSTPQYLVDYVVWKLAPWIREIPEGERDVFEPANGHAAFLVAAMRLLKEELSPVGQADRRRYLRKHLHGVEIDSFAVEIARLSLTLADIPNPNGWDLACDDMFTKSLLQETAKQASILLGNPPFEDFSKQAREEYAKKNAAVAHTNKTAEVLAQVLPHLRVGGVFGFVVPQGILHGKNAADVRTLICRDFEIQEICLFPDKVFSFSDAESAVILGRRVSTPTSGHRMSYRRVREADMERFRSDYVVSSKIELPQPVACTTVGASFRFPDLFDVWAELGGNPRLGCLAELGQGLFYKGRRSLEASQQTISAKPFPGAANGFANVNPSLLLHELPGAVWMSLDDSVVDRKVTGATTGTSQVLLNYAPVSRGPWRLKALIDRKGHAVTSRFITVRPVSSGTPLEYLWAILNNPLANAYVYAHSMKRDVLVGLMRSMPVPAASSDEMASIASLANKYLEVVTGSGPLLEESASSAAARDHLLMVDAAVLRLYALPPKLERQLLDLFARQQRVGVPFTFDRYFPANFEPWLHLDEYLSEAFRNSSAAAMLKSHRTFNDPAVSEALRRATEDFEE